jgi:tripartite-type tricarboxylate transporter receptor subunit TctC
MPMRRWLLAVLLPSLLLLPGPAAAAWPERPITIIVPYGPGGGADIAARAYARVLEEQLGQPAVIVNRPGAGGGIGFAALRRAAPDGHTIGVVTGPNLVTLPIERAEPYHFADFALIGNLVDDVGAMFVRADSPLHTLADLIAFARANPGAASFATTGIGTYAHFAVLSLERLAGIRANPIHFTGTAVIRQSLLSGDVLVAGISLADARAEWQAGLVRPLAQLAERRAAEAPTTPTAREQGQDIVFSSLRGFAAPPGTPEPIRARLEAALRGMAADPAIQARAAQQGMPLGFMTGAELLADFRRQDELYRRMWQDHPWKE